MSFFSDILSNPIVDAGISLIPGAGIPLAVGAKALGNELGGTPGQSQGGGGAIPLSAFNTSGGTVQGGPSEANQPGNSGVLGSLEGLAGKAGSFLSGNNGANALGTVGAISSYLDTKKSNDLAKQALGNVESSYNQRAPLRAQGLSMLANSQVGNPYATGR